MLGVAILVGSDLLSGLEIFSVYTFPAFSVANKRIVITLMLLHFHIILCVFLKMLVLFVYAYTHTLSHTYLYTDTYFHYVMLWKDSSLVMSIDVLNVSCLFMCVSLFMVGELYAVISERVLLFIIQSKLDWPSQLFYLGLPKADIIGRCHHASHLWLVVKPQYIGSNWNHIEWKLESGGTTCLSVCKSVNIL